MLCCLSFGCASAEASNALLDFDALLNCESKPCLHFDALLDRVTVNHGDGCECYKHMVGILNLWPFWSSMPWFVKEILQGN